MPEIKKVCFEELDKRHADLKIRLHYDGLTQNDFFSLMIAGYIEKDENIMKFIEDYKEDNLIHSQKKRSKGRQLLRKGKEVEKQFALDETDVESIFDMISKEHPDL